MCYLYQGVALEALNRSTTIDHSKVIPDYTLLLERGVFTEPRYGGIKKRQLWSESD